jgi:hypothetical protein
MQGHLSGEGWRGRSSRPDPAHSAGHGRPGTIRQLSQWCPDISVLIYPYEAATLKARSTGMCGRRACSLIVLPRSLGFLQFFNWLTVKRAAGSAYEGRLADEGIAVGRRALWSTIPTTTV